MEKWEWRKNEKSLYLPKKKPELIEIPEFRFVTIEGEGRPGNEHFSLCIEALFSLSYAVKMGLKKRDEKPKGYCDYTVYPLEGIWDLTEEGRKRYNGTLNKDDLAYKLMIRQPDYVDTDLFEEFRESALKKKGLSLLKELQFETIGDGPSVQMLHVGSYDDEPASFQKMEEFASDQGKARLSKRHREIYLSDFRKTEPEKLKTVLRFQV